MPLILVTDTNPGEARWADASTIVTSGAVASVQTGAVVSTPYPTVYGQGFLTGFVTATADGGQTGDIGEDGVGVALATDGTENNNASIVGSGLEGIDEIIFGGQRPVVEHRFRFPDRITDVLFFAGLAQVDLASPATIANLNVPYVGLQFDSSRDGTLQVTSLNATGGVQNLVDTEVVPVADAVYRLVISADSTTSWVVTLWDDQPGSGDADDPVASQLFTTTITDPANIPDYTEGMVWCVGVNETAGGATTFSHFFANISLRDGVQV